MPLNGTAATCADFFVHMCIWSTILAARWFPLERSRLWLSLFSNLPFYLFWNRIQWNMKLVTDVGISKYCDVTTKVGLSKYMELVEQYWHELENCRWEWILTRGVGLCIASAVGFWLNLFRYCIMPYFMNRYYTLYSTNPKIFYTCT